MNCLDINRKNKLESDLQNNKILFKDYRATQFQLLKFFLKVSIDYISSLNNNYLELVDVTSEDKMTYYGVNHIEQTLYEIIIKHNNQQKLFTRFYVPKLIDNSYFIINENYYVPTVYILDKPIVIKFESVKLYSLFNSITIYAKKDVCIFCKYNIPLSYFMQLFLNDTGEEQIYTELVNRFKLVNVTHTENDLIIYFNDKFGTQYQTLEDIKTHLETIFFDIYTKRLYEISYNMNPTLSNIVIASCKMLLSNQTPSFIDLSNKRLMFMELLLSPYFKAIGGLTQSVSKQYETNELKIDQLEIMKHFIRSREKKKGGRSQDGLDGNYLYGISNLYGVTLVNKCSFVNPGSVNPPSEIANIHPSFYKKICPITVADMTPGHTVSILPDIFVDWFGNFIDV